MSRSHHPQVVGLGDRFRGICTCRTRGPLTDSHDTAEAWGRAHVREVERNRARVASPPSLARSARIYREQAAETDDPGVAAQFLTLATEIEHRLGVGLDPVEQLELFQEGPGDGTPARR